MRHIRKRKVLSKIDTNKYINTKMSMQIHTVKIVINRRPQ